MKLSSSLALVLIIGLLSPLPVKALGPMYSFHDLVAGEGTIGMEDGSFYSALFHTPLGMALNPESSRLYVADRDNHALRVIDLSEKNKVTTLTGNGKPGAQDGSLASATFNHPSGLVFLPGRRLVVNDAGNALLRLVDLDKGTVSTLAGNGEIGAQDGNGTKAQVGAIWNMAYLASKDSLYFTQPSLGVIRRLDLKTLDVSTLLKNNKQLPHPAALCATKDKLYSADKDLKKAYEVIPWANEPAAEATPSASIASCDMNLITPPPAKKVLAMVWSSGVLYALEADPNTPVATLAPPRELSFISASGDFLSNPARTAFFSDVEGDLPLSLVPDPLSGNKFFLDHPSQNIITSFRDLSFNPSGNNDDVLETGIMDFNYPLVKPPNVFRLLLVGDSHLYENYHGESFVNNRQELMAKRLELFLNTTAALEDSPNRFEVLTLSRNSHEPLNVWPYYSVPPTVKKYDIDLVLLFQTSVTYNQDIVETYFLRPLTSEGIPVEDTDPEYLVKPWKEKIVEGLPKTFFDLCQAKHLVIPPNGNNVKFKELNLLLGEADIRACAVTMYGKPIQMLKAKLASMKTSHGDPVRFEPCLIPLPQLHGFKAQRPFWDGVKAMVGPPFMDLADPMTALRVTYYPLSKMDDFDHYNSNGHLLVGYLLARELISQKMIPLEPGPK